MWAVQIGLIFPDHPGRNLYAALVRRCMHKGLELFYYLNLKNWTLPYSRTLCRAPPCPHFFFFFFFLFWRGKRNVSTCCQQSFFGILLNGSILPPPFVLATYPKVSSPRAPRRRQRKQPACCGGAAFFFHNKTWTIIPTLGSLRVYVHPWSGTVSFFFLPCSRYPNSRKCVHTPQTDLTRNPFSRTNTTPTHT